MSDLNASLSQSSSPLFAARGTLLFIISKFVAPMSWGIALIAALGMTSHDIHIGYVMTAVLASLFAALVHHDFIHLDIQIATRWYRYGLDAAKEAVLSMVFFGLGNYFASFSEVHIETHVFVLWMLIGVSLYVAAQLLGLSLCLTGKLRKKPMRILIVGIAEHSVEYLQRIRNDPWLAVDVRGFVEDRTPDRLCLHNETILGRLADTGKIVQENDIQMVYIALPMKAELRLEKVLEGVRDSTAAVYYIHDFIEFPPYNAKMEILYGVPLFSVCESPFEHRAWIVKEIFDRISALIIILLISPLLLIIAAIIKYESPGPVIFRQVRYGMNGQRFYIRKFRSMRTDLPASTTTTVQATRNDPRVTRIGAFIRRTSIDELPQLFNVMTGEMSLVGPRPHAADHNEHYRKIISGYMLRHKIKPGITGWAQVNGLRGETDTIEKMADRVKFDLEYLRCWSISLDLLILLKTVKLVLSQKNAY
jgi:putative colanic acid biosysnthesis UDP-glucose lipid carrier transferase